MKKDQLLSNFLTNNQKRIDCIRKELSACPRGTLYEQLKRGKPYFIQGGWQDNKDFRVGITSKPELVHALIRKFLLLEELKVLEDRQNAVKAIESTWPAYNLIDSIRKLQTRCPSITDDMIAEALTMKESVSWANEPYPQSDYKLEDRKHINSHGLKLRSKSEVLISEKLYEYNIPFHYEEVIQIDQISVVPDFTIMRKDGKRYIWEHQGLTNVESYLQWQAKKARLYASIGVVPWNNFIVTYDSEDGLIDVRIVESEIRNKLLL